MIAMAALFIAAAVAASSERRTWAARYLVGGTIGAAVGFVFVNTIYLLVLYGAVWWLHRVVLADWLRAIVNPFVGYTLAFGPLVFSLLGFAFGFLCGVKRISVRRKKGGGSTNGEEL